MSKDRNCFKWDLQGWFKTGHSKIEINNNSRLVLRIALRIPTAHDFLVISARSQMRVGLHIHSVCKMVAFSNLAAWLARDKSSFFLGNEYLATSSV